jgi:hypothetical protein
MPKDKNTQHVKDIIDKTLILINCLSRTFLTIMYKRKNLKLKIDLLKAETSKLNFFPPILKFSI